MLCLPFPQDLSFWLYLNSLRADNMSALEERATVMLWAALHRQDIGAVQNMIRDGVDVNEPDIVSHIK